MKKPATFVLWKWQQPASLWSYEATHVNQMALQIRAAMDRRAHKIICVTDDPAGIVECETYPLWSDCAELRNASGNYLPSCYRRLKLYDPETQRDMDIGKAERIISLDLDACVCNPLHSIIDNPARFVGWGLRGTYHDSVFNGSLQSFEARDLEFIWKDFDPERSPIEARDALYKGSDQAWLSYKLRDMKGTAALGYPEIASWPLQERIFAKHDYRTVLVFFHGAEKPWMPEVLHRAAWVRRYWT